jgi:hypothetical protein
VVAAARTPGAATLAEEGDIVADTRRRRLVVLAVGVGVPCRPWPIRSTSKP